MALGMKRRNENGTWNEAKKVKMALGMKRKK